MRLREFKDPQKLDEFIVAGIPLWAALATLFAGGAITYNNQSPAQKKSWFDFFASNFDKNKAFVKKVIPYLAPGGLANGINSNIKIEKLKPIINNPDEFNLGIKNTPGNSWMDKPQKNKLKSAQPPLSIPFKDRDKLKNLKVLPNGSIVSTEKTKKNEPGVLDSITNWFKDTFTSDNDTVNTVPQAKITKQVLSPSIDNDSRKVNPAYKVPTISAPTDNGDGTITWNGGKFDKVFDKDKIAKINQSIIDQQKIRQQRQIGTTGTNKSLEKGEIGVVGPAQRGGKDGVYGNDGVGGQVIAVPGASTKGKEIVVVPGTVAVPGASTKGKEIVVPGTVAVPGAKTGTGTATNAITANPAVVGTNTIAQPITVRPVQMPPPIAKFDPKYRKYNPKTDGDIIYKGKDAPKNISTFKAKKQDKAYWDTYK